MIRKPGFFSRLKATGLDLSGKKLRSGMWGLGYSNVGKVIEKGAKVAGFEIGDIVYSSSPHQTQVVKDASEFIKVPKDLDPKYVIFVFNLMTTYNAILDARIKLGDVVVVSGLGLLGQLCAQMAKMSGAAKVYGIDTYSHRRQAQRKMAATRPLIPSAARISLWKFGKEPTIEG